MAASSIPAATMLSFVFMIFFESWVQVFTPALKEVLGDIAEMLRLLWRLSLGFLPNRIGTEGSARPSGKPVRHLWVFITHCSRYNAAVAPPNAPASWPFMDRTKPQSGSPFPKRKTKHRFVRLRALTAGGALAELCQRLVSVAIAPISNCLNLVNIEKRLFYHLLTQPVTAL